MAHPCTLHPCQHGGIGDHFAYIRQYQLSIQFGASIHAAYWAADDRTYGCPPVCIGDARDAHSRACIEIQNNMDAWHSFGIKYTMQLDAAEPWLHLDATMQ